MTENVSKTIEKALELVDIMAKEKNSLGVHELARKADLNPATAYRLLEL